ncbi:MFS transporter [Qipengyuania qiaonensis]|uniref:MFS transporter n=1 Tax=Qipengyuania qiaonensis TaxID=2867240 RepID=A0ABS7JA21_9SPHN|nr:MFS transporter [Qipengyuania qiaonensis]MBX7484166.1 MFS transporter [Qipengyuania qiaonensis]
MPDTAREAQPGRFLLLYALAAAGGAVAYVPFLTILLPLRMSELAAGREIQSLAYTAFAGAIAASIANIAFGWASDRTGTRRPWILGGLVLSSMLLVSMRLAETVPVLVIMIVAWQFALNMMLAPLAAWAGDCVPDHQKGVLGGLLAISPALGALAGALITLPGLAGQETRLVLVAALVALMVGPALLFARPHPMPQLMDQSSVAPSSVSCPRSTVVRMWLARLLVQIAEASLFAFLLFWFTGIDDTVTDHDTAKVFSVVLGVSVPLAIVVGRWSDRTEHPIFPLVLGAGIGSVGLAIMALSDALPGAIAGYVVFGLSTSVFLALHSSQTLRVLPKPRTRGRDLGLFNLTNTVPSLIMPWLTLALVPLFGFEALFVLLAALCAIACILLATLRRS